jgi:hypothetical protein
MTQPNQFSEIRAKKVENMTVMEHQVQKSIERGSGLMI